MVERFDRGYTESGYLRFGLASGLTMLDAGKYYLDRDRWPYLLLADQLRRWSEKPNEDRIQLFRRMVFNAAVTNNDDHPRNHAVRRTARGWHLTPASDLVPVTLVSLERPDLAMIVGTYVLDSKRLQPAFPMRALWANHRGRQAGNRRHRRYCPDVAQ